MVSEQLVLRPSEPLVNYNLVVEQFALRIDRHDPRSLEVAQEL